MLSPRLNLAKACRRKATYWFVSCMIALLAMVASTPDVAAAKRRKKFKKPASFVFNPSDYLTIESVADQYGLSRSVSAGGSFKLAGAAGTIFGRSGKQLIYVNNTLMNLIRPVVSHQGRIYLSKIDTAVVVDPLLRPSAVRALGRVTTVVVDAGHGGHDSGARSRFGMEKHFTLDTAQRLAKHLRSAGYKVIMTRTADTFVPLATRAEMGARQKNAIFVSLHYNKGRVVSNGVETYALTPKDVTTRESSALLSEAYRGNKTDGANVLLAAKVHSRMATATGATDRGVKFQRFHVLRQNAIPSVLVEGGFLSHNNEGRSIAEAKYRETLARAIALGIKDYSEVMVHGTRFRQVSNENRRNKLFGMTLNSP